MVTADEPLYDVPDNPVPIVKAFKLLPRVTPDIVDAANLDTAIAADAFMSALTIVPSAIIVEVTVPVSPVVIIVPVTAGKVIVVVPAADDALRLVVPETDPEKFAPPPPIVGVVSDGDVPNTSDPEPVSSVIAAARFADDGVPSSVAIPVPSPDTPVDIGSPVALVNVPLEGVPSTPPFTSGAPAEPTLTASAVATPVPSPDTPVDMGTVTVPLAHIAIDLPLTFTLELVIEEFAILLKVFLDPLIVLFVSVCVPDNVATVESIAIVTAADPLKDVPDKPVPMVNAFVVVPPPDARFVATPAPPAVISR